MTHLEFWQYALDTAIIFGLVAMFAYVVLPAILYSATRIVNWVVNFWDSLEVRKEKRAQKKISAPVGFMPVE